MGVASAAALVGARGRQLRLPGAGEIALDEKTERRRRAGDDYEAHAVQQAGESKCQVVIDLRYEDQTLADQVVEAAHGSRRRNEHADGADREDDQALDGAHLVLQAEGPDHEVEVEPVANPDEQAEKSNGRLSDRAFRRAAAGV